MLMVQEPRRKHDAAKTDAAIRNVFEDVCSPTHSRWEEPMGISLPSVIVRSTIHSSGHA